MGVPNVYLAVENYQYAVSDTYNSANDIGVLIDNVYRIENIQAAAG